MKGAIGNAFILNMVITFIIIFFTLLIGSMAYTKAYKTKNYLLSQIDKYASSGKYKLNEVKTEWDNDVNDFLRKTGYSMSTNPDVYSSTCPDKTEQGYSILLNNSKGRYDYCIYSKRKDYNLSSSIKNSRYTYMVLVYMKLDLPVIGKALKMPITGETKTYTKFN